jgi:hypothetical protein
MVSLSPSEPLTRETCRRTPGGACPRGEECRYRHELVPVNCLPPRLRVFLMEDSFPESREGAEVKQQVISRRFLAAPVIRFFLGFRV